MTLPSTSGTVRSALRAVAIASALACCAGVSMAADATLKITSFTVSAADFSGNFVYAMDPFQSYNLTALEAGGLLGQGSDNFSANDWNLGLNRTAKTTNTSTVGNTVQFTDGVGNVTAGFNLSATANAPHPSPALANYANASAVQSGSYVLLNSDGAFAAGSITFDVYYDMSVSAAGSSSAVYSQTALNVLASSDSGTNKSFTDGLLSNTIVGGTGSVTSGHFTWSYTLAAGDAAYYTLSGSAITNVAAIPEPSTYALMALGLAGIAAVARRRRGNAA